MTGNLYTVAQANINNAGTTAATGSIAFGGQPTAGNTITIAHAGNSDVYEFYANGGSYEGDNNGVEIGTDVDGTVTNLAASITSNDTVGVGATADTTDDEVDLEADVGGTYGNEITVTNDDSDAQITVPTMSGGAGQDLVIAQIESQNLQTGVTDFVLPMDGGVDSVVAALNSLDPVIPITSSAVGYLLARLGLSGLYFESDVDELGGYFYLQKMTATDDARATGASHMRLTVNKGRIFPQTLQASQNQYATLAMNVACLYDGTNNPIIPEADQSLSGTAPTRELFTLGPVYVQASGGSRHVLETTQSMSLDFGINLIQNRGDGQPWPYDVVIGTRQPRFTIGSTDVEELADLGLIGTSIAQVDVFLRKMDLTGSGGRVADATAEHIRLRCYAGRLSVGDTTGSGNTTAAATTQFTVMPIYDGSNDAIGINCFAAIA